MIDARLRRVLITAGALMAALMAVFAYSLADSQRQARRDLEKRFHDRAEVSALLTSSLFSATLTSSNLTMISRQLGGATISPVTLQTIQHQGQLVYVKVLDSHAKVIAATAGAPAGPPVVPVHVMRALHGALGVSDLIRRPGGQSVTEIAVPFHSPSGLRVEITGSSERLIGQFLTSFLAKVPNVTRSSSEVLDSKGNVLGGTATAGAAQGQILGDPALLAALRAHRTSGSYGDNMYFTSAVVAGTPWVVVLRAAKDGLYSSINGSRRTVPWVIFAAFVLTALAGLLLLGRVMRTTAELERRDVSQRHAVEINDNIIQRLVLAKYALDRGAAETSQDKLAETLTEAQRLVSDLLEEEIEPGDLRRKGPARITDV